MQLLYVFGQNNGELGFKGANGVATSLTEMKTFFLNKNNNIKFITKGGYHALIVLEDQNCDIIYGAGSNIDLQLGVNDNNEYLEIKSFTNLRKRIKFINCGYSHTFIVTEDFKCYGLGVNFEDYNNFKEINSLDIEIIKRITQVICGGNHTALILQNGELYVHGDNSCQELDEDTSKGCFKKFVKSKFNKPIIDIAFGINHCLMITKSGEVYGSGNNSPYHQLGIENNEGNVIFEKIFNLKAQRVYCGYYHSFILTIDFEIYSCGWNYSGELCLGYTSNHVATFQKVNLTSITINPNDFEISVGFQQIFVKTGNEIYCGGYNGYGGLGLGDSYSQNNLVKHPICEKDKTVNEIICGGHGTFFVMNERKKCKKGQLMINNLKKVLMKNNEGKVSLSDVLLFSA